MAESFWAAAGPSRSTASSFVAVPAPSPAKKKRGRFSGDNKQTTSIPSIVNPPSPELVPRHSSSASSWGIEDFSDSDGDCDWPAPSAPAPVQAPNASPDLDRDELAKFARPSKRAHLETPEDRHTYGRMAGLQIDPTALATSAPNQSSFGRPQSIRSNSGVAGAFGLGASLASAFGSNTDGPTSAPRVPPSSPTKSDTLASSFPGSASNIYQQAVAPAPPTSPSLADRGLAPPSSPIYPHSLDASVLAATRAASASTVADLEDSDMRARRGVPSSYEVEPDRIVVTSLDDTSSSEGGDATEVEGNKTPDADTSTESKDSASDFLINHELMEKLEAHSRAVLTGTSDRDNAASNSRSGAGGSVSTSRSRRTGRRSGGSALPGLGSLLSSRRRSAQSSPGSSGYASPINAEDARGALILWKDPEEVLKSTSASSSSPLKPSELTTVPEGGPAASSFMSQPPVSFQSATGASVGTENGIDSRAATVPGLAALPSPSSAVESPLYAQQSSLSSSYFPEPSPLETRFGNHSAQQTPQAFGSFAGSHGMSPRTHHDSSPFATTNPHHHVYQQQHLQQAQHQYGHSYNPHPPVAPAAFPSNNPSAWLSHPHTVGAQPIDLSGCFGPAEEMDLDS